MARRALEIVFVLIVLYLVIANPGGFAGAARAFTGAFAGSVRVLQGR